MSTENEQELICRLKLDLERGEDQDLEFMEDYPNSEHELKKEIAAFATSNAGSIYLGIDNDRNIIGMNIFRENSYHDAKDKILNKLSGLCQNAIRPSIRINIEFIKCSEGIITKLSIPKGIEPVYYSNNIPYIRILTSSTPATPDQIKELHRKFFLSETPINEANYKQGFLNQLSNQLSDYQILWYDHENRNVNPDLDQNIYDISKTAEILEGLNLDSAAEELGFNKDLAELIDQMNDIVHHEFFLGEESWNSFTAKGNKALELNNKILNRVQKNYHIQKNQIESVNRALAKNIRELQFNWQKRDRYDQHGELPQLKETFRRLAYNFNRIANLQLNINDIDLSFDLRKVAKNLRDISSNKYFGYSQDPLNAIKDIMDENMTIISTILEKIEG